MAVPPAAMTVRIKILAAMRVLGLTVLALTRVIFAALRGRVRFMPPGIWLVGGHSSTEPSNMAWPSLPPGAAGQLAGVSRSRRIMTCEVLMDHTLATGTLLTTRQPSAA